MNKKVYQTLEFNKIIELLTAHASSEAAKKRCKNLTPMTELSEIVSAQEMTKDALSRIYKYGSVSFSGIRNVFGSLKRLELGGSLSCTELLHIAGLLEVTRRIKAYGRGTKDDEIQDSIAHYFDALEPATLLREEINRCILGEDEYSDDASATLKSIRKSIRSMNNKVHGQLNSLINNATIRTYLQDVVITMRNGRYCLPVRAEYKNQVPGMIHDQSSTGSTVFIEPLAVVNLNNELKALLIKEQEEIEVILADLSNEVATYASAIEADYKSLVELDFIFAKANLAKDHNGVAPEFNEDGIINIRNARHPLLDPKKVVPIDVMLGEDFNLLIITGPNTGGKTVSLKTVGLLTLMGQSGLHIPAGDRSRLSIFTEIFADIGDEQSIEQNLSTFSSHMKNITYILRHADERSLVLFDELCAGTDPVEGAALAISILDSLHKQGIRTMATTHYSEIKLYALSTEGVENGSQEFDVTTLSPTYRLLIGIPGKSNAFAISGKLGLPKHLIEDAKNRISSNEQNFEDILSDLEKNRVRLERDRSEVGRLKAEAKRLQAQTSEKQEKLNANRDRVLREANEEAARILQEAKEIADATIRNFQKYGSAIPDIKEMEKERAALREKISDKQKKSSVEKKKEVNHKAPKNLRIGDKVKVLSMNLTGTVHTLPDAKGNLFVQMGILRSQVAISDLVLIEEDTTPTSKRYEKTGAGKIKMSKSASISPEIMLIGKTVDEAICELDKYLDDAYLAHLSTVRIVHGKGTGALRNAVHSHLKRLSYIDSFHLGEFGEGDAGVTIAEFK